MIKINHRLAFMAEGQSAAGKTATTVTIPKQPRVSKGKGKGGKPKKGGHPLAEWNKGQ